MALCLMLTALLGADDPVASKSLPKLFKPVDLTVEPKPVGAFLKSFADEHGIQIVVDGRVDGAATVRGRFKRSFVERILNDAARFANARMTVIGEIVYVGPQESADRAAAAAFHSRKSIPTGGDAAAWKEKRSLKWTNEATVQTLVAGLAKDLGVEVKNAEELDVKASAGSLKNVTAGDMLSVFAALADQTWTVDEKGVVVVSPLPEDARLERRLRAPSAKEATRRAEGYRELPETALNVEVKGAALVLKGPFSALWAAERLDREEALAVASAKGQKPGKSKTTAKRYTVNFKNLTLGDFAKAIADHVKMSVEIDDESIAKAGKSREDRLNCVATGVELDELLALALEPIGLAARIDGSKIVIHGGK
jgi:type II secretory pathway component GspD/PulD (secretin)